MKIKRAISVLLTAMLLLCTLAPGAAAYSAGDTVAFGSYPQSEITLLGNASVYLALSRASADWHDYGYYYLDNTLTPPMAVCTATLMKYADVEYDGNLYRGVKLVKYRPESSNAVSSAQNSKQDDNGYRTAETYWFRYEPIQWIALDANGLLIAQSVLDGQCFCNTAFYADNEAWSDSAKTVYSNVYKSASIRSFLTADFCNTAFSDAEKACLQTDASLLFENDTVAPASKNIISQYCSGLRKKAEAKAAPTDYAKCQGLAVDSDRAAYYLRDIGARSSLAAMVGVNGSVNTSLAQTDTVSGVRPVIKLKNLNSYKLNYNTNGGSGSVPSQTRFCSADFTVTSTVPARKGYDFLGWADKADAVTALYHAGDPLTLTKAETTLFAVWQAKSYTVSFDANGGSCDAAPRSIKYEQKYGTLPVPTRNGYFFLGWFASKSTLDKSEITADSVFTDTADKILCAHWSAAWKVTYYPNANGETAENVPAPQIDNVRYTVPDAIPFRAGYSFLGWAKSPAASAADYEPGDRVPSLLGKLEADLDLYAVWKMINTAVSLREPSITTVKYGDSLVLHADIAGELPKDAKIEWRVDNGDIFEMNASGKTCTVTPKKSGTATFTVSITDKGGRTLYTYVGPAELKDSRAVTSDAGFFRKLAAFFKKLFKTTKVYDA